MTPENAARILAAAATIDNRKPDPATAKGWAETLNPDITIQDALNAVKEHYASSREWLMPADINRIVARIRRERIHAAGPVQPAEDLPASQWHAWLLTCQNAIADGMPRDEAETHAYHAIGINPPIPQALTSRDVGNLIQETRQKVRMP